MSLGAHSKRWNRDRGWAAALGFLGPQPCARLKFDLLRDGERIIKLDPEITHGAFQLRVPERVGFILRISFLI